MNFSQFIRTVLGAEVLVVLVVASIITDKEKKKKKKFEINADDR